jgi:hypothetical protein
MEEVVNHNVSFIAGCVEEHIKTNQALRSEILSIGIPILMRDGKTILRGPVMKIPAYRGSNELDINADNIKKWTYEGWIDLREENFKAWQERLKKIMKEIKSIPEDDTSSQYDRDREYWMESDVIEPGKIVGWLFLIEDAGIRMKE